MVGAIVDASAREQTRRGRVKYRNDACKKRESEIALKSVPKRVQQQILSLVQSGFLGRSRKRRSRLQAVDNHRLLRHTYLCATFIRVHRAAKCFLSKDQGVEFDLTTSTSIRPVESRSSSNFKQLPEEVELLRFSGRG